MNGMWVTHYRAWNSSYSFQYTLPGLSTHGQLSLFMRWDYDTWTTPLSEAVACWTNVKTTEGDVQIEALTPYFALNGVTEAEGILMAYNCHAGALTNFFFWS